MPYLCRIELEVILLFMSVDLKVMKTDASFVLLHKISTHFLIAQSKLSCHVINFWR